MKAPPDKVANYFFRSLMHNQCHICWSLFSKRSQDEFLKWTLNDIYERHPEAARQAKIGPAEVKLLFENNDVSLMKTFWKRFFFSSGANEFFRFGYYATVDNTGSQSTVRVLCKFPDGRSTQTDLLLLNERGNWKLGYVEASLPF